MDECDAEDDASPPGLGQEPSSADSSSMPQEMKNPLDRYFSDCLTDVQGVELTHCKRCGPQVC